MRFPHFGRILRFDQGPHGGGHSAAKEVFPQGIQFEIDFDQIQVFQLGELPDGPGFSDLAGSSKYHLLHDIFLYIMPCNKHHK